MLFAAILFGPSPTSGQERIDFAHDVLPVFQSRCAQCHSNGVFKGGLSLETRKALVESGAVEVGSRNESELFSRIDSVDPDVQMPPEGPRLTKAQIESIGKWIDSELEWPEDLTLKKKSFKRPLELNPTASAGDSDTANPIDGLVHKYFQSHSITAPSHLSDREFLRRAKLDLLGQLPTANEVSDFDADTSEHKRAKLVDELLSRNRDYADHWISFWNDLLRNDYAGTGYIDGGRQQITEWLHRSLVENKPYDQFTRELINPAPESAGFIKGIKWRGRVNASQIEPLQFSQNISQVFLGINMKCASCHDSFIDDWKLADAYGLAAITAEGPLELHRCDIPTGTMATSKFVFPNLGEIDGSLARPERLARLAELMTTRENGRFARTIVNRLWERLSGRGLVHPVDIMANEAWSEPLLERLAVDLVDNGYDLKRTLKLIATSEIYQSQSVSPDPKSGDSYVFRGIHPKRMTAEQFADAVWLLSGAGPTEMNASIQATDKEAVLIRASLVNSDAFMRSLGRPNREQVVTTRPGELSTLQALDLSNGELLNGWISQGAKKWADAKTENDWTTDQMVSRMFFAALSRQPTKGELEILQLDEKNDLQNSIEDTMWLITMLPEFQFIR